MAEGLSKHLYPECNVKSAGIAPERHVSSFAVKAMAEAGINISGHVPVSLSHRVQENFDLIVCFGNRAYQASLHVFQETKVLLFDVEDPWGATGSEQTILSVYLRTRIHLEKIVSEICSGP